MTKIQTPGWEKIDTNNDPTETTDAEAEAEADRIENESQTVWKPRIVMMNNVEAKPIDWLWKDFIPAGMLSLIAGLQGIGKSFTTVDWAARISTGTASRTPSRGA